MGITLVVAAFILLVVGVFAVEIFSGLPDLEELEDLLPLLPNLNMTYETTDGTERPMAPAVRLEWARK